MEGFRGIFRIGAVGVSSEKQRILNSARKLWALTAWTEEECKKIMENCYRALPEGGKLIVCEPVLPEHSDHSLRTRALLEADIFMMTIYRVKSKQKTEQEFKQLGLAVGFSNFKAIYYIDFFHTLMEFTK